MLTLNKRNPIVRFAYSMTDRHEKTGPPDSVTLCGLFWRLVPRVAVTAFLATIAFFAGDMVWAITRKAYEHGLRAVIRPDAGEMLAISISAIAASLGLIGVAIWLVDHPESWLSTMIWALKNRVCPVIYLKGDDQAVDAPADVSDLIVALRNAGFPVTINGSGGVVANIKNAWAISSEADRMLEVVQKTGRRDWSAELFYDAASEYASLEARPKTLAFTEEDDHGNA